MRAALVFAAIVASVSAQQGDSRSDPMDILFAVRRKVMQTVDRLPRYLCTETVDRSTLRPNDSGIISSCDALASRRHRANWKVRRYSSDRFRIDVAVSGDSEMFSWVGEDHFQDRSLAELIKGGATSTGIFSSFLGSIFGTSDAHFTYNGDVSLGGMTLSEFGFRVPLDKSKYSFGNRKMRANVDYQGTFLVNPDTSDRVSITVDAGQLPAGLNTCESTTILTYGKMMVNDSEFLIPKEAQWNVVNQDGSELHSRAAFSACHEFRGESTLSFADSTLPKAQTPGKPTLAVVELPPNLPFSIALVKPIIAASAAEGDTFQARLTNAIRGAKREVLLPAGASITGRIMLIERRYGSAAPSLTLALKLETVEVNGATKVFNARLATVVKRRQKILNSVVARDDLGNFDGNFDPEDASVGLLHFEDATEDFIVPAGMAMLARTGP